MTMTMTEYEALCIEIHTHPHKDELLRLMSEQIDDMHSTKYLEDLADTSRDREANQT